MKKIVYASFEVDDVESYDEANKKLTNTIGIADKVLSDTILVDDAAKAVAKLLKTCKIVNHVKI